VPPGKRGAAGRWHAASAGAAGVRSGGAVRESRLRGKEVTRRMKKKATKKKKKK
jgi:hypothetical protein